MGEGQEVPGADVLLRGALLLEEELGYQVDDLADPLGIAGPDLADRQHEALPRDVGHLGRDVDDPWGHGLPEERLGDPVGDGLNPAAVRLAVDHRPVVVVLLGLVEVVSLGLGVFVVRLEGFDHPVQASPHGDEVLQEVEVAAPLKVRRVLQVAPPGDREYRLQHRALLLEGELVRQRVHGVGHRVRLVEAAEVPELQAGVHGDGHEQHRHLRALLVAGAGAVPDRHHHDPVQRLVGVGPGCLDDARVPDRLADVRSLQGHDLVDRDLVRTGLLVAEVNRLAGMGVLQ